MASYPSTFLPTLLISQIEHGPLTNGDWSHACCVITDAAVVDHDGQVKDCTICLEPMDPSNHSIELLYPKQALDDRIVRNDQCGHSHHVQCFEHNYLTSNRCPDCNVPQYDTNQEIEHASEVRTLHHLMSMGLYDKMSANLYIPEVPVKIIGVGLAETILFTAYHLNVVAYNPTNDPEYAVAGIADHADGRAIIEAFYLYSKNELDGKTRLIEILRDQIPSRIVGRALRAGTLLAANDALSEFAYKLGHLSLHAHASGQDMERWLVGFER